KAVVALGGAAAVVPLRDLLLTYRSDPAFLADPQPLELAAEGLLAHAGPDGRRTVVFVADEPRTVPPLSVHLRRVLAGKPAPRTTTPPAAASPPPPTRT